MKEVGAVLKIHKNKDHLHLECENAQCKIQIINNSTLRVQLQPSVADFSDFSYSVLPTEVAALPGVEENESEIQLTVGDFRLIAELQPLRLKFVNHEGTVIMEDEPTFGTVLDGTEMTAYKKLQEGERFLGLGEKTGPLDRKGQRYVNWNTDQFGYHNGTDPLYASFPFYIGIAHEQPYGLYLDNPARTEFNFGASTDRFSFFRSERGGLDYYFIYTGESDLKSLVGHYTALTGRSPLPPKWSLGFQQCRYSYFPDTEVLRIAETFREKDIPADVMYLDIHYMQDYKVFTWNKERFAEPEKTLQQLKEKGFETVTIVDPGIKVEEEYPVFRDGVDKDVFLKYPDGEAYKGEVWPGPCYFPDFTRQEVRDWWGGHFKVLSEAGIKGFWNDMNEPAVWGHSFPDLVEFDCDGQPRNHKGARNLYGFQMARATYEGTKKLLGERPFVLTRSAFAGVQRYSAVWTGDNVANDEHMFLGTRLINSLGLSGVWFSGNDIGGFIDDVDPAVFTRWIQVGAFSPFFRCHSMVNSRSAEPWTFGENTTEIARNYIKLRYRLMPFIYSFVKEATETGLPLQRTLALQFPLDWKVYKNEYENQFTIGDHLMVAPCKPGQDFSRIYLPEGQWYDFYNDELLEGNREIVYETPEYKLPIFVKAGAIIPMTTPGKNVYDRSYDELELHVYPGKGKSSFNFYDDDGRSFEFEKGAYCRRKIELDSEKRELVLRACEGSYSIDEKNIRVYLHGTRVESAGLNSETLAADVEQCRFIPPLTSFDPWESEPDESIVIEALSSLRTAWNDGELVFKW